jgi:hypothetical protein
VHEVQLGDRRHRRTRELLHEGRRVGSFHLEPVHPTAPVRVAGEELVFLELDVPPADLSVEADPVVPRLSPDQRELVGRKAVEDAVTDHIAIGTAHDGVA